MLHVLPVEVMDEVFSYLSLDDTRNLSSVMLYTPRSKDSYKGGISTSDDAEVVTNLVKCINMRNSITNYLSRYFHKHHELLFHMLLNDAVICGSLAINFFNPGVMVDTSDYNFLIPNCNKKISSFIAATNASIIDWYTPYESFLLKLGDTSKVHTLYKDQVDLAILNKREDNQSVATDALNELRETVRRLKLIYELENDGIVGDRIPISATINVTNYSCEYTSFCVIYSEDKNTIFEGRCRCRCEKGVTLRVVSGTTIVDVLEHIRSFKVSILQCCISGSVSLHMYPNHLYSRKSVVWREDIVVSATDSVHNRYIDTVKNRYEPLKFKFATRIPLATLPFRYTFREYIRSAGDSFCESVNAEHQQNTVIPYRLTKVAIWYKTTTMRNFTWLESYDRLYPNGSFYGISNTYYRLLDELTNGSNVNDKYNINREVLNILDSTGLKVIDIEQLYFKSILGNNF